MYTTPSRTPSYRGGKSNDSTMLRRAPIKNPHKQPVEEENDEYINNCIRIQSNPAIEEENKQLKEIIKTLKQENCCLKTVEIEYKSQIASLKQEIADLEVFKKLIFTRNSHSNEGESQIEQPLVQATESNITSPMYSTPQKRMVLSNSIMSTNAPDKSHLNRSAYYGPKTTHPPIPVITVEDSLIDDSTPVGNLISYYHKNVTFSGRRDLCSKRESFGFRESPSFLAKRSSLSYSLIDRNSDVSLSLNTSVVNRSGARHALTGARDISFHSCSSIVSDGSDMSLLKDVNIPVDFDAISLSGVDGMSVNTPIRANDHVTADINVNDADLSYEALLRWEQQQGGVLNDKWKEIRDRVLDRITVKPLKDIIIDSHNESHSSCCICSCDYDEDSNCGSRSIRILPCSHMFHKDCADSWFMSKWTCPFCKFNLMEWSE